MTGLTTWIAALSACFLMQQPSSAVSGGAVVDEGAPKLRLTDQVEALIRIDRPIIPVGNPVMLEFVLRNRTEETISLTVPDALVSKTGELEEYGMGLPLEHIFSGTGFRGLDVSSDESAWLGDRVTRKPQYPVPPITLAPFASVGLRFDVARFYPILNQSGLYEVSWKPYGGQLTSNVLLLKVVQYRQVTMETEYGPISIQLLYDKAPRHVENFLDLIESRFYNGKVFHRVYPGSHLLGGSPDGQGIGKRPDGVTLPPEFNDTPFDIGTIGMALIEPDVNSASCQFFICLSRQPAWDGRYTAFAQVIGPKSIEVLKKLSQVETDRDRHPLKPLLIKSLTALDVVSPSWQGR